MPKERFPAAPEERHTLAKEIVALRKKRDEHRKAGTIEVRTPEKIEDGVEIFGEAFREELAKPVNLADQAARRAKNVLEHAKEAEVDKRMKELFDASSKLRYSRSDAEELKLTHAQGMATSLLKNTQLVQQEFLKTDSWNSSKIANTFLNFIEAYEETSREYPDRGATNDYCKELEKLKEYSLDFFERNLGTLETEIKKGKPSHFFLRAVPALVRYGDLMQREEGTRAFRECEKTYEEKSRSDDSKEERLILDPGMEAECRAYLAAFGSEEFSIRAEEEMIKDFRSGDHVVSEEPSLSVHAIDHLNAFYDLKKFNVPEKLERIAQTVIKRSGLDARECVTAWRQSAWNALDVSFGSSHGVMEQNLNAVLQLEAQRPGAPKLLRDKFGVLDFARYPQELLAKQFDEFENTEKPYGVLIEARDDHNGVLYHNRRHWKKLLSQLGGRFALRAAECASKQDIARLLIRLNEKYGSAHKISFALLAAHGGEEGSATFGPSNEKRHRVTAEDLQGKGAKRLGEFFEPDAPVVLVVCYGGDVLGGAIEAETKLPTIGPEKSGNVEDINATFTDDGKVRFQVKYNWTDTMTHGKHR